MIICKKGQSDMQGSRAIVIMKAKVKKIKAKHIETGIVVNLIRKR